MLKKRIHQRLFPDANAVAGIIVAVMLLGLIVSVISIIQMVYVPKWMEEREAEHMGIISNQMAQFKYALDTLTVSNQKTPITSSITLGSKELGFLSSSRAFGHIQLVGDAFTVIINRATSGSTGELMMKTFTYTSENAYFLNQKYTYEAGALILSQTEGNVLLNAPSLYIKKISDSKYKIIWNCIHLKEESRSSVGGYGTIPLRMTYFSQANYSDDTNPVTKITIKTTYPTLWKQFFIRILTEKGFTKTDSSPQSSTQFQINDVSQGSEFEIIFSESASIVYLDLYITTIYLQIGPGWSE